ncbi:MAG: YrhK family protein [Acidimicrobiia bacterium]|nr:YrhK family protein [Acidimicrobiia bacterium]
MRRPLKGRPGEHPRVDRIPQVPEGWRVLETWGALSFITHALLERPDGSRVEWNSRRHRKHLGLRAARGTYLADLELRRGGHASASSWWMGALFMIGAFCFALGSFPLYFDNVDAEVTAVTFFVGSIFFTSAASLQFHEAVGAPTGVEPGAPPPLGYRSFLGLEPHRIDWWSSAVQLVGTVFFNVSTFSATRSDLSLQQERHLIWAPDVWGSVCFLIAGWLAYSEVSPPAPRGSRAVGGLVDQRSEPAGIRGVRRGGSGIALPAQHRRDRKPLAHQRGDLPGGPLLLHRRRTAARRVGPRDLASRAVLTLVTQGLSGLISRRERFFPRRAGSGARAPDSPRRDPSPAGCAATHRDRRGPRHWRARA